MVDFRYHLVSIIAVFLALAVGIVLGATAIEGQLVDRLEGRVDAVTHDRDVLRDQNAELTDRSSDQTRYGKAVLPYAVGGRLVNERVVLVSTPGISAAVRNATVDALLAAGAIIAGRVQVTDAFVDPAQVPKLEEVLRQVVNSTAPGEGTAVQRAANQVAIAVSTPSRGEQAPTGPSAETERVLSLFDDAGLLSVDGDTPTRSSAVVVLVPPPAEEDEPGREERVRTLNELIGALGRQAPAVVAVSATGGAADGGVLASLRRDQNLSTDVSSVDHADTPAGQAAVVLAIVERLHAAFASEGSPPAAGHYGDGPGADKPLPEPADLS